MHDNGNEAQMTEGQCYVNQSLEPAYTEAFWSLGIINPDFAAGQVC